MYKRYVGDQKMACFLNNSCICRSAARGEAFHTPNTSGPIPTEPLTITDPGSIPVGLETLPICGQKENRFQSRSFFSSQAGIKKNNTLVLIMQNVFKK